MKNILITGANSYIGTSIERWLQKYPDKYSIDTVDMISDAWKQTSFVDYDVVFHVAGIAHVSADTNMGDLYNKVNRDLAIETAQKAKVAGVKQFIFMSSIIVYGDSSYINKQRVIRKDTVPEPANFYGKSKLQAEEGIRPLQSNDFKVVILRPPMIYGMGSKGNYSKLASYAVKLPIFPNIDNQRSMLHVDNLCEFIRLMIDNEEHGMFFPQNAEYVKTAEMVRLIAEAHGKKIRLTKVFNPVLQVIGNFVGVVNKAFGNLVYEGSLSTYKENYQIRNLKQTIMITEATTAEKINIAVNERTDTSK
jgi:UDP-glucose 4-epimerase